MHDGMIQVVEEGGTKDVFDKDVELIHLCSVCIIFCQRPGVATIRTSRFCGRAVRPSVEQ